MELIHYLNRYFMTREQLLAAAGIDAARLAALQDAGMMPQPSYRLRLQLACDSFFGAHQEDHTLDYYARGACAWLGLLGALDEPAQAFQLFAERYRRRIAALAQDGIAAGHDDALSAEEHIAGEWRHFLAGTYGLCTASGLPEDIAAKEAAIVAIRELTAAGPEHALSEAQRTRLRSAVDLLDAASAPFAPHELARSSRRRYVDAVRAAWLI